MDTLMTIFSLFSLPIFTFTSTSFSRIFIICNCIWFYSCLVVGWLFHSLLMLLLFLLRSFPCVWAPLTYISLLVVVSVIKSPWIVDYGQWFARDWKTKAKPLTRRSFHDFFLLRFNILQLDMLKSQVAGIVLVLQCKALWQSCLLWC